MKNLEVVEAVCSADGWRIQVQSEDVGLPPLDRWSAENAAAALNDLVDTAFDTAMEDAKIDADIEREKARQAEIVELAEERAAELCEDVLDWLYSELETAERDLRKSPKSVERLAEIRREMVRMVEPIAANKDKVHSHKLSAKGKNRRWREVHAV